MTEETISSAEVPVLVVPPQWQRSLEPHKLLRILVPLDGSRLEQVLPVTLRLADVFTTSLILLRATPHEEEDAYGAREYIRHLSPQVDPPCLAVR